jgi:hypothetical protein
MNVQGKQQVNSKIKNGKPLSKIIGEVAVLASIRTSSLGMSKIDRSASKDSDSSHHARAGTAKVNVNRLPGAEAAVDAIKKQHGLARQLLWQYTSQWGSDRRLLPNVHIGEFTGEFDVIQREHIRLVNEFVANAQRYIAEAERNLGNYEVTPPSMHEISNAFALEFELAPVPDISAYTTGDSALEQSMKQRFEADITAAYEGAQKDLLKKLADPLENLIERMKAYDEREELKAKDIDVGRTTGTFKTTVITNIQDIAKVFRSFNLTNDPFFENIALNLEAFAGIEHADLTKSQELRAAVAAKAADIRGLLGTWLD